mgnify:CR=1 FL=1
MTLRRKTLIRISACALAAIATDLSSAKYGFASEKPGIAGAVGPDRCSSFAVDGLHARHQLTISQPPHDIMPLDDVLADIKPHECGSLVGVRLMQLRSLEVYRLRILKDTGGVIDLYVNARTGVPL